jgi:hypothetical protein
LKVLKWDEGKRLVHVHVGFQNPRDDVSRPPTQENELWVDPANSWRIIEAKQTAASGLTSTKLSYGQSVDGLTFPVQSDVSLSTPVKMMSPSSKLHANLLTIAKTTKTSGDFRLSAFGLPEPRGTAPERAIPNYIWLLAAAVACAALAMGCWYIGRRWRAQAAK